MQNLWKLPDWNAAWREKDAAGVKRATRMGIMQQGAAIGGHVLAGVLAFLQKQNLEAPKMGEESFAVQSLLSASCTY